MNSVDNQLVKYDLYTDLIGWATMSINEVNLLRLHIKANNC
jgi:hypothetical protein